MAEFDLNRFKVAQSRMYLDALEEVTDGCKFGHWMWFIFPQLKGLGFSTNSKFYGLAGKEEARAYISDKELKDHLLELCGVLIKSEINDPEQIFGPIDAKKLNSCMTLFAEVAPEIPEFQAVIDKFFNGEKDSRTLDLLRQ